ncbi:MAG: ParB/RepB/Spo0J family partition protein [Planctomycetota bacterium]|jgi:ParB family chromosome partitioning protein
MPDKRPRGLGSLLSRTTPQAPPDQPQTDVRILDIPLESITPSPKQPRRTFQQAALASLAESIRQHGLLQPIVVRQTDAGFELIAGERRWRAARLAGLTSVRAVCKPTDPAQALVLSVIENLQRQNLNPIEEATAYRSLRDDLNLTQEQIASYVGRDRTTVANTLRLLDLPVPIQAKLASGSLTAGHARVLLAVTDPDLQATLADRAANRGMSVRELERAVYGTSRQPGPSSPARASRPAHLTDLENRISERLGVKVAIREGRRGGKLVISFRSNQEFMRVLDALGVSEAQL